jgi:hypothetical protein
MAPRGWAALSSRKQWLDSKSESYILARASNTLDAWLTNLYHEYFMVYHWSLEDNEEPDPNKSYPEPMPEDKDSACLKEKRISTRKDVSLLFSSM